MGLFGKKDQKTKEQKEQEQRDEFMERYQLEDVDQRDLVVLERIARDLGANSLIKTAMALSFTSVQEQAKVTYLSALVEQNWMIIRQLSRINQSLERLLPGE
jgi:hypothetical protein